MRKWGIALDQATLQETAYALGINKRVAEMTRAQKTELAYYQIMHATQYAQGNMARTLLTPASALRIVQTEFKQLGRAMGSVFIPIALKIIPVIRAITQVLTELARKLAALFGFKIEDYDFSAGAVQDISASFGDLEDNVNGTTKALKKMLMPFDELNNVNFDTGGGSGGIGGVGGGSLGLDTYDYDMFAGATDEINKKVEQIKNTFEKLKPVVMTIGGILAGLWAVDKIVTFIEWLKRVKAVSNELSTVLQLALIIGGAFLIYKGIKKAIETDWNAESLLMMIGGTGLIAVAGALKFKSVLPLQIALGLSLILGGVWLLYKGIKHAIDVGKMDTQSILQTLSGGALLSVGGAILFKNPAMLKIGLGLTLALEGIALEYQNVKKMLSGDISLGTILKATGDAFLIGLGVWLLTGSITAGLLATAGVLAFNLGIEIGMALKQVDWAGIWEKITDACKKAWEAVETFFTKAVPEWWNNNIAPWFTKEKWQELGEKMKEGISSKWQEFKDWWGNTAIVQWWDNNVAPWFTKEKWQETANNAKEGMETKLTEWKDRFKPIEDWWNDKVAPWFTLEKWKQVANDGKKGIEDKFNEWKNNFHPIKDWWDEKVKPWFTWEKWKSLGHDAVEAIQNAFSNFSFKIKMPHLSWTTTPAKGWVADILGALNLPTSLPKLNIEWYAGGGFPKEGQIFGANENGPELIGNIGRRTAVANQQQITEGISEATYSAFSRALSENRSNNDTNPYFVIKLEDDTPLYRGQAKKENQYSNMYGVMI